jgi:hypothetical protein
MNRLYQWLSGRASFFRSDTSGRGASRTVRTEVTVERQGVTLLLGGAAAVSFDVCPLCGNKLAPAQTEKATASKGSDFAGDRSDSFSSVNDIGCSSKCAALADNDITETERCRVIGVPALLSYERDNNSF